MGRDMCLGRRCKSPWLGGCFNLDESAGTHIYDEDTVLLELPMRVEVEREDDGRWIGEVPALPGVLAYGATADEARTKAEALALRVVADRLEHGEPVPSEVRGVFAT